MNRGLWAVLILVLAPAAAAAPEAEAAPDPADLLPATLEGWEPRGGIQRYPVGKLYDYIDGGADVIEEYGFETAAVREWSRGEQEIAVQVYRMRDGVGACGVCTQVRGTGSRLLTMGDGGYETDYQIGFWKGRWYVQCDLVKGGKDLLPDVRALARSIAGKVTEQGAEPAILTVVRGSRMEPRSEVLLRGPLALASAEAFAGALATEGFEIAAAARYRRGSRITRILVADYGSPASAEAALRALAKELEVDTGPVIEARLGRQRVLAWRRDARVRLLVRPEPPAPRGDVEEDR